MFNIIFIFLLLLILIFYLFNTENFVSIDEPTIQLNKLKDKLHNKNENENENKNNSIQTDDLKNNFIIDQNYYKNLVNEIICFNKNISKKSTEKIGKDIYI